ncbi:MAG: NAD(P)/FAD-dependent oxidoreductase [Anaerovibrio sp.]|uniref:NAD(P)/FAD-dependent oxidoreductase n=1 Tax=Anaerovibrio sp. TaxID=1872532 RepID=UPI0025DBCC31|nr:NAD(P)/FAD-dependent oxidoreductase [Anaerovibrio sp.]MCR5176022.1 NAD(P)/FAD-dependent oxidoreductase [Anaerovibrio sp.]
MIYDAAIVGSGPAGLSAAIVLKMRGKSIIWFGSGDMSQKIEKSAKISNYPGLGTVSGHELNNRFKEHIKELDLEINDRLVTTISNTGNRFMLLANNDVFEAKTLLLATGVVAAKEFPGEAEYLGRGVSYCATCDGFFYKGKTVAVYCANSSYLPEVSYLAGVADKVYLFSPDRNISVKEANVEIQQAGFAGIQGDKKVEAVELNNGEKISVDGVFILRNAISPAKLLPGLEMDGPHITVNRQLQTNIKGCYAAGDITGRPYQITKGVGEGNVAAHEILEYLASEAAESK